MSDSEDAPYDFAPESTPPPRPASRPPASATAESPRSPKLEKVAPSAATGDAERECPFCGFTYFGKAKARCPECAAPMDAGSADQLQFASPAWVSGLSRASMAISLSIALHAFAMLARIVQIVQNDGGAKRLKGAAHLTAAILLVWAVFTVTRPEPGTDRSSRPLRITARICALLAAALWSLMAYWALLSSTSDENIKLAVMAVAFCQLPLAIALGLYLKALATRIPDDGLASHAALNGWLVAGVCVLAFVLNALEMQDSRFLSFFPISFPIIAATMALLGWAAVTALRIGLNMRASARVGIQIQARKQERTAARKK